MFKNKSEVSEFFDPELDRDLVARINEARSAQEISLYTSMASDRLRFRARKARTVRAPRERTRAGLTRGLAVRP